jgi:hypothetical protein
MDNESGPQQGNTRRGYIPAACVRYIEKIQGKTNKTDSDKNKNDPYARGIYRATWVIAGAGVLTFGAAVIQAVIFNGQLSAMRSSDEKIGAQVEAMKRQLILLEADQRPWISATMEIAGPLIITSNRAEVRIKYRLENVGRAPAFNVVPVPVISVRVDQISINSVTQFILPEDPVKQVKSTCDKYVPSIANMLDRGVTLLFGNTTFPHKFYEKEETAGIGLPEDVPSQIFKKTRRMDGPLLLVSCVTYRGSREGKPHQTGDVFYLKRGTSATVQGTANIDITEPGVIPANELQLIPVALGAYAD